MEVADVENRVVELSASLLTMFLASVLDCSLLLRWHNANAASFFNLKRLTMAKPNLLTSIKLSKPRMSGFDMSHDVKLSGRMGRLIPVNCIECVPSDKVNISHESLIRMAPMIAPMMHRCDVSIHSFFVPSRLLWGNFEKWITNQKIGSSLPAFPTVQVGGPSGLAANAGSLANYLGIPIDPGGGSVEETVSALPFAAYQLIYNEYYRDQNQENEILYELSDGDNTSNGGLGIMRNRCWEHDYFTAAAPTAQAGEAVDIPLGQFQDVPVRFAADSGVSGGGTWNVTDVGGSQTVAVPTGTEGDSATSDLWADTSELQPQATTINDLRTAFRLQEWLEKSMRGGRRLFENILIFFGLKSPDMRMQRPEYIGGVKTPIQISEVLNTTGTEDAPQGTMAGHGVSVVSAKNSYYNVQEWGYVISILSVMPKTAYQQGIPRFFLKYKDPMQIFWPQFDHLGEQPIENRELFAYTGDAPGDETFGYIPRYAEYKFMNSRVCGEFADTLNFWHMGRIFDSMPALNQQFVQSDPTDRIFAVQDGTDNLWMHVYVKLKMIRPMSKFSTPTF